MKQGPKKSKRWEKIIIERVLGWLWGTSGVGRGHPPLLDRYAGPEFRAKIRSRRSPEAPPVAGRLSAELLGRHRQNEEISAKFVERTTEVLSVHQPSINSAHIHISVEEY